MNTLDTQSAYAIFGSPAGRMWDLIVTAFSELLCELEASTRDGFPALKVTYTELDTVATITCLTREIELLLKPQYLGNALYGHVQICELKSRQKSKQFGAFLIRRDGLYDCSGEAIVKFSAFSNEATLYLLNRVYSVMKAAPNLEE